MPPRFTPCPEPGCPELRDRKAGDCPRGHAAAKRQASQQRTDAQRPTARQRGYDRTHEIRFRTPVLRRDPVCTLCHQAPSVHADHHPHTRAQLAAMGENPNDPRHGRGLCHPCHSSETARRDGGYGNTPNPGD